jgi:hypothetical protein
VMTAGRFPIPPTPQAPVPVRAYKTQRGPWLAGVFGIFERQPDMSNLAQSSAQEAAFITNGRGYPAVSDCRYHVRYVAEGEARRSA